MPKQVIMIATSIQVATLSVIVDACTNPVVMVEHNLEQCWSYEILETCQILIEVSN